MSWERTHRRYELVYAAARVVLARGPRALVPWTGRIEAEYGSMETFRLDVLRRWNMTLDVQLDEQPGKPLPQVEAETARGNRPLHALVTALENHAPSTGALPQPA